MELPASVSHALYGPLLWAIIQHELWTPLYFRHTDGVRGGSSATDNSDARQRYVIAATQFCLYLGSQSDEGILSAWRALVCVLLKESVLHTIAADSPSTFVSGTLCNEWATETILKKPLVFNLSFIAAQPKDSHHEPTKRQSEQQTCYMQSCPFFLTIGSLSLIHWGLFSLSL